MKTKIVLLFVFLIGFFTRFYKLGQLPNSYTPDEISQGYTAYSLLTTGKDEWGQSWPLTLKSFGDYKPPLQTYLMIPAIKFFGLNTFSIRLPNALTSSLAIISTYLLAKILFKNTSISLISAFLLAISPWHLPMSRIALEANLHSFFIPLAIYFFLKNKPISLIVSSLLFGISTFSYHSVKLFVPMVVFLLFILNKKLITLKKYRSFLFILISFLLINFATSLSSNTRIEDISILSPTDKWQSLNDSRYELTLTKSPEIVSKLFKNKYLLTLQTFLSNYLSYFSPQFLVNQGPAESTYGMISNYGTIGIIPFLFLVLLFFNFPKHLSIPVKFLSLLILFAPIPAALAKSNLSANRASVFIPYIQILTAYSIFFFYKKIPKFIFSIIAIIFSFNTLSFLFTYFKLGNTILAKDMLYGHKQANEYIKNYPNHNIIYSRKLSEPQAYVAFFQPIDPIKTQKASQNWQVFSQQNLPFLDQLGQYQLDRFTFKNINFNSDAQIPNTILVGRPEEFIGNKPDYIIYYPPQFLQKEAIYIYINK